MLNNLIIVYLILVVIAMYFKILNSFEKVLHKLTPSLHFVNRVQRLTPPKIRIAPKDQIFNFLGLSLNVCLEHIHGS